MDPISVKTVEELASAVANPQGVVQIDADISGIPTLEITKNCDIDLNGFTLEAAGKTLFKVLGNGVVCNISGEKEGSKVKGTLILGWKDGDGATLNVKGGEYEATVSDEPAIQTNGLCKNVTLLVEDAVLRSTDDTFYLAGGGVSTIKNCEVFGATGLYVKGSKVSLVDTIVYADGPAAEPQPNGNGASSTGDAIIIDAKKGYTGDVELVVDKDSELHSVNRYALCETYTDDQATVARKITVKGYVDGPVTASQYFKAALAASTATVDFDGAVFTDTVDDNIVPEGKSMFQQIDGTYSCKDESTGLFETVFGDDAELVQAVLQAADMKFADKIKAEPLETVAKSLHESSFIDSLKGTVLPVKAIVSRVLDVLRGCANADTIEEMEALRKKALMVYLLLYRAISSSGTMK